MRAAGQCACRAMRRVEEPDRLLRARRERPRRRRAAECGQQFPPSDGDCHTPLPCEVRKGNDTTPRACCPLTARLAPRGRPPKNGAIDHPQPGADKVDMAEGMATLEAMSSHHNFRPGQQNKLVSEPPIAAPDEHAQLVEADQRFRAALGQAIAAGGERIEAVEATVQLKRRTKLAR